MLFSYYYWIPEVNVSPFAEQCKLRYPTVNVIIFSSLKTGGTKIWLSLLLNFKCRYITLKLGHKKVYDVEIQVVISLAMIAESELSEQLIDKFYYHEIFFLQPFSRHSYPKLTGDCLPPQHKHLVKCRSLNRLTQNLQFIHELAHRALWFYMWLNMNIFIYNVS